jgi:hypothetical protein
MKYAEKTSVSSDKSRNEIEKTLMRYGARGFIYGWQETSAVIGFQMNGRQVKFILPLPDRTSREFTHTPGRHSARSAAQTEEAYEQAVRQKWRALSLVIKAKLEAVESGITDFQSEFLAHILLPNGGTIGHWMIPQVDKAYETGVMPSLIPLLTEGNGGNDLL